MTLKSNCLRNSSDFSLGPPFSIRYFQLMVAILLEVVMFLQLPNNP